MAYNLIVPVSEEEEKNYKEVPYSDKERKYRNYLIDRLEKAKNQHFQKYSELDDDDYNTHYDKNYKAGHGYLRHKKNPQDTRLTTATTQEKEVTILSSLLGYNFEPTVSVWDQDDMMLNEFATEIEALVKKSREIEKYELKKPIIYKQFLDQGTIYVDEIFSTKTIINKEINNFSWQKGADFSKIEIKAKVIDALGECEANMLDGRKVYLGNMKQFFMTKQPYVAVVEYISYAQAERIFCNWERWKYVPKHINKMIMDETDEYGDWTMNELSENTVEICRYQDKWANEFQLFLNGVMMLPAGFPLTEISPSGEYSLVKGDLEPISQEFAISKSYPAKTKVDQQLVDEILRLFTLKTQLSAMPPTANNTGQSFNRGIYVPGMIIDEVNPDRLQPIGNHQGVTQSEFAFFELLRKLIDEKTANPIFSGDNVPGDPTATQIMQMQKNQMMKLGLTLKGVINFETQLVWHRIYNIMAHYTDPVRTKYDSQTDTIKNIYRTITLDSTDEEGRDVYKIIDFDKEKAMRDPYQIQAEEKAYEQKTGRPTKVTYLNPEMCKKMEYKYKVTVTATPQDSTEVEMMMFKQNIADGATIFGPQALNYDYLKTRFAVYAKEDPDKFFIRGMQQNPMMGNIPQAGQINTGINQQTNATIPKASLR